MTTTVYGKVLDPSASAMNDEGCHAYDLDTLERCLDETVPVDLDHDRQRVGEVVHLETDVGGLFAVAVLDDLEVDDFAELDPVYFSGEFLSSATRGRNWIGSRPRLLSLALTCTPAALGLQPVKMLDGDVRRGAARYMWPINVAHTPLLQRTVEMCEHRHRGDPLFIADRVPHPEAEVRLSTPRLELRSVSAGDVHRAGRTIELIAAPHETPTAIYERGRTYTEEFAYGAFRGEEERAQRIKVNRDHDLQRTIGRVTRLDPLRAEGTVAEVLVARTPLGDETLALAQDHCLDASVGFGVPTGGETWDAGRTRRRVTKALLHHIALVPDAAYPTANVLAVRSTT